MWRSVRPALRATGAGRVLLVVMSAHRATTATAALTAACLSLLLTVVPATHAAPEADSQGYVDSTARCAAPASVVVFGSTASSRIAICRDSDGEYQYRGVRVRDGARLILPAQSSGDGEYTADNDGIEYSVTSSALVISSGGEVLRREPMLDFHSSGVASSPKSPGAGPQQATPTPTTPLPPPLPAEAGADDGSAGS